MEEEFDTEVVVTGDGNAKLGAICEGLFYKSGDPMMYVLSKRLTEPAQQFDANFAPEADYNMGMEQ
ncbi:MAG: hypothetical protein IJD48_01885 [Clostridia bacterium]|nr:hypothetical protein [Clostridia bacterium]